MIESTFELQGLILNNYSVDKNNCYFLDEVIGLDSPETRSPVAYPLPLAHGIELHDIFFGGRDIVLRGKIRASSKTKLNEMIIDLQEAANILQSPGEPLKFQETGLAAKQINVVHGLSGRGVVVGEQSGKSPRTREFLLNLFALDPRIYAQSQSSENVNLPTAEGGRAYPRTYPLAFGTVSIGGALIANNAGNFPTYPIIKIYGPVDNPILQNVTDGNKYLKLNLTISADDYVEFNFKEKTIKLNGTASRYLYLSDASNWWEFLAGDNEFKYKADTYQTGSYANIVWRSAWI